MSNGGFIGKRLVPTLLSAKGVWGINELYNASLDTIWPELVVPVLTDFLIIAGGGGGGQQSGQAGGGAGGYLNSYGSESSGANSASLSTLSCALTNLYAITIGAGGAYNSNGSNSSFTGTATDLSSISLIAIGGGFGYGGGSGGAGGNGGSGGGSGGAATGIATGTSYAGGTGTSNQGFAGGITSSEPQSQVLCDVFGSSGGFCDVTAIKGAGGGGAGSAGAPGAAGSPGYGTGGAGLASSITGTSVTRAAGGSGRGETNGNSEAMPTGSGPSSPGGGGLGGGTSTAHNGGNGIIILRYNSLFTLSNPGGGLTISTATDGSDKVSTISAGSGNIQFNPA